MAKNESAVDKIMKEAVKSVNAEVRAKYVDQVKTKLRNLHSARAIVKNIEREIEDLEDMISEETS